MKWLFASVLVFRLFSSTVRLKYLKETVDSSSSGISLRSIPRIMKESYRSAIDALRWMPRNLWVLAIIMMLTAVSNAIVGPFWVLYGIDHIGLSATQWGVLGLAAAVARAQTPTTARTACSVIKLAENVRLILFFRGFLNALARVS